MECDCDVVPGRSHRPPTLRGTSQPITAAVALELNGSTINYGDLNRRANRLAGNCVQPASRAITIVAVCGERSIDVIVGLLAVLKAGGAYLPLTRTIHCPGSSRLLATPTFESF